MNIPKWLIAWLFHSYDEKAQFVIEALRRQGGPMYGLELVAESGGLLKGGTVYVTLGRMEEKGLIVSIRETLMPGITRLPRRLYSLPGQEMNLYVGKLCALRKSVDAPRQKLVTIIESDPLCKDSSYRGHYHNTQDYGRWYPDGSLNGPGSDPVGMDLVEVHHAN